MTPLPLEQVGFGWRSHRSALWYLGLLYRRPRQFEQHFTERLRWAQASRAAVICFHTLPWMLITLAVGRWVTFGVLGLPALSADALAHDPLHWHLVSIATALGVGIAIGTAVGTVGGIASGIAFGISVGVAFGIVGGTAFGVAGGIAFGIAGGIAFGVAFGIVDGIVVGVAFGIAFGIAGETMFGVAFGIAFGIVILRVYYYPLHCFFVWPSVRGTWYRYHPVAWDDLCSLPFPGMELLLVAYCEHDSAAGAAETKRLIDGYASQRPAALRARARLVVREAGREHYLPRLPLVLARLWEGEKGISTQTQRVRDLVGEIARQQTLLNTLERPALREPHARLLHTLVDNFRHQVSNLTEPLASEFRAAAAEWLQLTERQLREAQAVSAREPTPQLFRAGNPVDRSHEAFVSRHAVFGELERQALLAAGCPGLVLYGRRRMGKSTVLRNVVDFLPSTVGVVELSMQEPRAFASLDSLVALLATRIEAALPGERHLTMARADLPAFGGFLDRADAVLQSARRRLLVALDEYENLDVKIGEGVFSADLLATLRQSIQSHRQLTWILAGSHSIDELEHAAWPSYLVSARTIEIGPFTDAETHLLLTEPMKHSPLWERDDPRRPHFDAAFWGEGGIARIQAETGGWPHLVQLIAETAVDLVNDEGVTAVTPALLGRALSKAIISGDTVLRELLERECRLPGEWDYVARFRRMDTQDPPEDEAVHRSLRRRLLVTEEGIRWRLRVPLMQRWLRERG